MNRYSRIGQYRIMWIFVFFDLPTETKRDRSMATKFRKKIMADGFTMFQFSIYLRCCPSIENARVHIARTKNNLPPNGHVGILSVTDKQFEKMELFFGKKSSPVQNPPQQLELF